MTKTFKSVTDNESELDVRANDCGVFIAFSRAGQIRQASTFAPSDAPALALAILEAALGNNEAISMELAEGLSGLRREVCRVEERDKATSELAELEAEARDFYDAYHSAADWPYQDWVMLDNRYKAPFLAVARKAREIGAKK